METGRIFERLVTAAGTAPDSHRIPCSSNAEPLRSTTNVHECHDTTPRFPVKRFFSAKLLVGYASHRGYLPLESHSRQRSIRGRSQPGFDPHAPITARAVVSRLDQQFQDADSFHVHVDIPQFGIANQRGAE